LWPARVGPVGLQAPDRMAFRARKIRLSANPGQRRRGTFWQRTSAWVSARDDESFAAANLSAVSSERRNEACESRVEVSFAALLVQRRGGFCRSIRVDKGVGAGKPAHRLPTQQSSGQMELTENASIKQWLAAKALWPLRVICATPFQKRSDSHRPTRFLCCVCRCLR
jgi:hypothetical protein